MTLKSLKTLKSLHGMKQILFIFSIIVACLLAILPYRLIASTPYTDDSYYWPQADTIVSAEPVYDKNIREFIFLEDSAQQSDTVRMRIIER